MKNKAKEKTLTRKQTLEFLLATLNGLRNNERLHIRGQFRAEHSKPVELLYHQVAAKAAMNAVGEMIDVSAISHPPYMVNDLQSIGVGGRPFQGGNQVSYKGVCLRACSTLKRAQSEVKDAIGQGSRKLTDGSPIYDYDLAMGLIQTELDLLGNRP